MNNLNYFRQLLTILAFFAFVIVYASNANAWSKEDLVGLQTFHSGPNCLNAVLVAKGIVPKLTYIDSVEMNFFLENYCLENKKAPLPMDILAVFTEDTIEHAALFLSPNEIFEKLSTTGVYSRAAEKEGSFYRMVPLSSSEYFSQGQDVRTVKSYTCAEAPKIQREIRNNCDENDLTLLNQIRTKLEKVALNSQSKIDPSAVPILEIQNLTKRLSKIYENDKCSTYLFAVGASTFGSLYHLSFEMPESPELKATSDNLFLELKSLKGKFLSSQIDTKTRKIILEFTWGGK